MRNHFEEKALSPKLSVALYPGLGGEGHLANMRCKRRGPKFYKCGKKVVYKVEDIERYLFKNPVLTIDSKED